MNQLNGFEEAYNVFLQNISISGDFLALLEFKEIRGQIREVRPLAILRDELGPARKMLKEHLDMLYKVGLPQTVVFVVSCFEDFLKSEYRFLKGQHITEKEELSFLQPQKVRDLFGEILKVDLLNGDEVLLKKVSATIQKRHIIVHRAGLIDKKAYGVFMDAQFEEGKVGDKLILNVDKVKQEIEYLGKFSKMVMDSLKKGRSSN
jgi:hypothetical protein